MGNSPVSPSPHPPPSLRFRDITSYHSVTCSCPHCAGIFFVRLQKDSMMRKKMFAIVLAAASIPLAMVSATSPGNEAEDQDAVVISQAASTPVPHKAEPAVEEGLDKEVAEARLRIADRKAQEHREAVAAIYAAHLVEQEKQQRAHEAAIAAQKAQERRAAEARAATTTTTAPPVRAQQGGSCGGWDALIEAHFPGEKDKACRVLMCESGGNPKAQNARSSASGLFQFLSSTWEATTGTPAPAAAYSPETQIAAAAKLRNTSGWGQWLCS